MSMETIKQMIKVMWDIAIDNIGKFFQLCSRLSEAISKTVKVFTYVTFSIYSIQGCTITYQICMREGMLIACPHHCTCVCACACVRMCVRAYVRACVCKAM